MSPQTSAWMKYKFFCILVGNFDTLGLVMNLAHEHAADGVLASIWCLLVGMPCEFFRFLLSIDWLGCPR